MGDDTQTTTEWSGLRCTGRPLDSLQSHRDLSSRSSHGQAQWTRCREGGGDVCGPLFGAPSSCCIGAPPSRRRRRRRVTPAALCSRDE